MPWESYSLKKKTTCLQILFLQFNLFFLAGHTQFSGDLLNLSLHTNLLPFYLRMGIFEIVDCRIHPV